MMFETKAGKTIEAHPSPWDQKTLRVTLLVTP